MKGRWNRRGSGGKLEYWYVLSFCIFAFVLEVVYIVYLH